MKENETLQTENDIWTGRDTATEIQRDMTHRDIDTQRQIERKKGSVTKIQINRGMRSRQIDRDM